VSRSWAVAGRGRGDQHWSAPRDDMAAAFSSPGPDRRELAGLAPAAVLAGGTCRRAARSQGLRCSTLLKRDGDHCAAQRLPAVRRSLRMPRRWSARRPGGQALQGSSKPPPYRRERQASRADVSGSRSDCAVASKTDQKPKRADLLTIPRLSHLCIFPSHTNFCVPSHRPLLFRHCPSLQGMPLTTIPQGLGHLTGATLLVEKSTGVIR